MVATRRASRTLPPLPKGPSGPQEFDGSLGDSVEIGTSLSRRTHSKNTTTAMNASKHTPSCSTDETQQSGIAPKIDECVDGGNVRRAADSGHFLQGIQLECFDDVLSIPDPPSPFNGSSRRVSCPPLHPLREISNASGPEDDGDSGATKKSTSLSKRKSMSSVNIHSEPISGVEIPLNKDSVKEINAPKSKRRKKRQSIMLPSDVEPSDGNSDVYTQTFAAFKNEPSPPATPARETKTPIKPPTATLQYLREIIHEYTLAPKARRLDCSPAKELFERTGYAVRSDPPTTENGSNEKVTPLELSRDQKLAFFMKLGPDLQRMDACKVSDAKMVAEVTQCQPVKVRGGFYHYVHSVNGRTVSPEEFEDRYLMMLEEVNRIRSQAWLEYFCKLRDDHETITKVSLLETNYNGDESTFDIEMDHMPQAQNDVSDASKVSVAAEESLDQFEEEDDSDLPGFQLPVRDEESSDPVIARAERKLWTAIDKALAEYSREVLAAQSAASQTPVHC